LDEEVTVEEVECLAKCDGAPCFQVNYEFIEKVSPQEAIEVVEDYKSGAKKARTISGTLSTKVVPGGTTGSTLLPESENN